MHLVIFSAGVLFAAGSLAIPTPDNHVVHERQGPVSRNWKRISSFSQGDSVAAPVRIGLKQSNIDRAHKLLMDV
jgi:tripeptidyl-peptidase-1